VKQIPMDDTNLEVIARTMGESPLFSSLGPENVARIAERAEVARYEAGETVVAQGEPSDSFFVILRGEFKVLVEGDGGERVEVGMLRSPESIGEMGVILDEPRTATVVAAGEGLVLKLTSRMFEALHAKDPGGFGMAIARALARRLERTSHAIPLPDHQDGGDVPSPDVLALLPIEFQQRHRIVPLEVEGQRILLGFVDAPQPGVVGSVRQMLSGMELRSVRIEPGFFDRCLRAVVGASSGDRPAESASHPGLETLLGRMVAEGASDLHLSAGLPPMIRVDGDVRRINVPPMEHKDVHDMVYDIMSDKQRKDFEEFLETDFSFEIPNLARFRVNAFNQHRGAGAVFRTIPSKILTLEDLNAPQIFKEISLYPRGIVLVTGPTGSGKSTTLAAMVDYKNNEEQGHILTIEDPIEFVHESKKCLVNQREVHRDALGFNEALRSALREDPDTILVGEMRDIETIRLALTAAETGHLVFGTLHTSSAAKTIDRVIDVFPAAEKDMVRAMLSESLRAVISQTLMKKIGGGRVAAHEIMLGTPAIRNLIREGKVAQMYSAIQTSQSAGMQTLDQCLADLLQRGLISKEEARRKASNADQF